MPIVTVEVFEGKSVEQKSGLVKDITDAVCKNFKVPADTVTIVIYDVKRENLGKAGKLASE